MDTLVKETKSAEKIIGTKQLNEIRLADFSMISDASEHSFIDWERYTEINDECNYTERLSFCTEKKLWNGALKIAADYPEMEKDFGSSEETADLNSVLRWLDNRKIEAEASFTVIKS